MRKINTRKSVERWVPLCVGVTATLLMAVRLLLPSAVGMGDNKDGERLMCQIGANAARHPDLQYWQFVVHRYAKLPGGPCTTQVYPTLMKYPLWFVAQIHQHVLGLSGAIDTREMSVVYSVVAGLVLTAAAFVTRGMRPLPRIATLAALFVVLAESTFADYADSPYAETLALAGLAVFLVGAVASVSAGRRRRAGFAVAWLGAVMAVGAKAETMTLVLPLGVFLLCRPFELHPRWPAWTHRLVPLLAVAVLIGVAADEGGYIGANQVTAQEYQTVNVVNEITETIMPSSGDPAKVAVDLGLPADFAQYSGTDVWNAHSMLADPRYQQYRLQMTMSRLGRYFATHPVIAAKVLASGSGPYLTFRAEPDHIGNYSKPDSLGLAVRLDNRVALVSWLARASRPVGFTGIVLYWLACLAGALYFWLRSERGSQRRGFAVVGVVLVAAAVVQYATAVFGEGHEVTKHMVIGMMAASLAPVCVLGAGFGTGATRRRTAVGEPASDVGDAVDPIDAVDAADTIDAGDAGSTTGQLTPTPAA